VGGCGQKLTEPKEIWFSSTIELLHGEGKKADESMTPMPKVPTVGAN
jgi:hypothetical protein